MKKYLFLILVTIISYNGFSQVFCDDFNGIDSIRINSGGLPVIRDFYNDGDSILYIIGDITYVNNIPVKAVFSWDGDTIKTYNENNYISSYVHCIYKYKDTLYLGGRFNHLEHPEMKFLMLWYNGSWHGSRFGQPTSTVYDICEFDNKLWFCGEFGTLGNVPCDKIGYYDGTSWNAAGSFGMFANALQAFNGELYSGGYWGLRRYLGGTSWETFTINPNGYVNDMAVDTFNTFLYVGGQFITIGNQRSIGCGMWDGFKWTYMDYIYGSTVWDKAMAVYRGDLYTGHSYIDNGDYQPSEFSIMRWDGQQWDSLGGNFSSQILALEVFRDELYIGTGSFTYDGQRSKGMRKMSLIDNGCDYIKPRINTLVDTFYIYDGIEDGEYNRTAEAQFYNNNPYVDSWSWDFGDGNSSGIKDPVNYYTAPGEYGVTVTVSHEGCERSYTKTIYVKAGNVGIEGNEIIGFSIFPNPSSGNFTVNVEIVNLEKVEIKIHSLNGHLKTIVPVNSSETVINTGNWSPGTYICNLFVDGKLVRTERVLVR